MIAIANIIRIESKAYFRLTYDVIDSSGSVKFGTDNFPFEWKINKSVSISKEKERNISIKLY